MSLIAIGYKSPQESTGQVNTVVTGPSQADDATKATVDDVVATNIAATVASATNLSVAPNVASLAVSTEIKSQLPATDNSTISKPQIVEVSAASRNIATYTVKEGDTVDSVAKSFGISEDTVKWANDLTSNSLNVGQKLQILPRDGIVYTVNSGDTVDKLAEKYKSDASVIVTYNDLEISGIKTGLKIIIPDGTLPETERPGYVAPFSPSYSSYYRATGGGNTYAYGYCTYYVFDRRQQLGNPIGNFWGDAGSWAYAARIAGYGVDQNPTAGSILVELGSPGHVAVVERVAANGDVTVSEMNNYAYGGWGKVNNRTISAGQAAYYWYIH